MIYRILAILLLASLLATACAAPAPGQQVAGQPDEPVITVYESPT